MSNNKTLLFAPRRDSFEVKLPFQIFEQEYSKKYDELVDSYNMPYKTMHNLCHSTIQGITPPNPEHQNITQLFYNGITNSDSMLIENTFIDQRNIQDIVNSKTITITFLHIDAYFTYIYFTESIFYNKNSKNNENGIIGDICIYFNSNLKNNLIKMLFINCKYESISQLALNYTNFEAEQDTFDVVFSYDKIQIDIIMPKKL